MLTDKRIKKLYEAESNWHKQRYSSRCKGFLYGDKFIYIEFDGIKKKLADIELPEPFISFHKIGEYLYSQKVREYRSYLQLTIEMKRQFAAFMYVQRAIHHKPISVLNKVTVKNINCYINNNESGWTGLPFVTCVEHDFELFLEYSNLSACEFLERVGFYIAQQKAFYKIVRKTKEFGLHWDCHTGNLGFRNRNLVVFDPVVKW